MNKSQKVKGAGKSANPRPSTKIEKFNVQTYTKIKCLKSVQRETPDNRYAEGIIYADWCEKEYYKEYEECVHGYDYQIEIISRQMERAKDSITVFFTEYDDESVIQTLEYHLGKIEAQRYGTGRFMYENDQYLIRAIKPNGKVESQNSTGQICYGSIEGVIELSDGMYMGELINADALEEWCDVSIRIRKNQDFKLGIFFSDKGRKSALKIIENYLNDRPHLITLPQKIQ